MPCIANIQVRQGANELNSQANGQHGLSKSRVLSGIQCHRRLWLETFRREAAKVDASAEARFAAGHEVGDLARALLGPGILIGHVKELDAALAETLQIMATRPDATLFEAAFQHAGVLVRADVLRPVAGGYDLIEVKASTQVKDYQLDDCAVQAWVITKSGVPLRRVCIAHVNRDFVYQGDGNYRGLLVTEDQTDAICSRVQQVPGWIDSLKAVLQNPEPTIHTGDQCHVPFECPFFDYCRSREPAGPEYPVTILPRAGKLATQLQAEGYDDLLTVPPSRLTHPLHRRIQDASLSQRPFLDGRVGVVLRGLGYPRCYLDFETVDFAVPRWAGTRPYQQIPFQVVPCRAARRIDCALGFPGPDRRFPDAGIRGEPACRHRRVGTNPRLQRGVREDPHHGTCRVVSRSGGRARCLDRAPRRPAADRARALL